MAARRTRPGLPAPQVLAIPQGWQVALCEPDEAPGPGCQPTVIARYRRGDAPTQYRGACLGCGWVGRDRETSNVAVEDAHDHTHPGWRSLPVVDLPRRTGDPRRDAAMLARVGVELVRTHPSGWPERCGPIRAHRDSPIASRHVPGNSPWGGYEMAVVGEAGAPCQPVLEQLILTL